MAVKWPFTYDDLVNAKNKLNGAITEVMEVQYQKAQRGEECEDVWEQVTQLQSVLYALEYFDYGLYTSDDNINYLTIDQAGELIQLTNKLTAGCEVGTWVPNPYTSTSFVPVATLTCDNIADCPVIASLIASAHAPVTIGTPGSGLSITAGQVLTLGGYTQGSVVFAASNGGLTEDNSNLFWDDTNNRLGLFTNTPTNKVDILAGSLTNGQRGFNVTTTLNTTDAAQTGVYFGVTTAGTGTAALGQWNGVNIELLPGGTGDPTTRALRVLNSVPGTGINLFLAHNNATISSAVSTTIGSNVGVKGVGQGGDINIGHLAITHVSKTAAVNAAVVGFGRNTLGTEIGGYFGLETANPTFTSSALIADNGGTTNPIFLGRDNGTTVFSIVDAGVVNSRHHYPLITNTYDLGENVTPLWWRNIYATTGTFSSVVITGLTPTNVLFVGPTGGLAENNNFRFITAENRLSISSSPYIGAMQSFVNNQYFRANAFVMQGVLGWNIYWDGAAFVRQESTLGGIRFAANVATTDANSGLFVSQINVAGTDHTAFSTVLKASDGSEAYLNANYAIAVGAGDSATFEPDGMFEVRGGASKNLLFLKLNGSLNTAVRVASTGEMYSLHHYPLTNNTYDLGENVTPLWWRNIWATTGNFTNISLSGFTQGSVIFAGASGALAQDNANFFWDDSNNRLGLFTATPSHKVDIIAGALATTQYALSVSATISTTDATQRGFDFQITGAGSGGTGQRDGGNIDFLAGYTGAASTRGLRIVNNNAGTGNVIFAASNSGLLSSATATTTGANKGVHGSATNGDKSVGVAGFATTGKANAVNIGVAGFANNTSGGAIPIGGYFGLHSTDPTFTGLAGALVSNNGSTTNPIFLATDNGTVVFNVIDGGLVGIRQATPTHVLEIVSGTLTSTQNALFVSGTISTTDTTQNGVVFNITGAGSGVSGTRDAVKVDFIAGFTGNTASRAVLAINRQQGIGTDYFALSGDCGILGTSIGISNGAHVGVMGNGQGGGISFGGFFRSIASKNNATNGGVVGVGNNTGTTPIQFGGYFGLNSTAPTFESAALIADNSDQTSPIFLARDNGTTTFSIIDGGLVGIGMSPTNYVDITATTLTGSSATSALSVAQTWNTSGTPTALKLNITNTASNTNSLLADFQTGSASVFKIEGAGSPTSGTKNLATVTHNFAPTSGTAVSRALQITGTINQTGGANGITTGLYHAPTLTAAADYYAIYSTVGKSLLNNNADFNAITDSYILGLYSSGALSTLLFSAQNTTNASVIQAKLDSNTFGYLNINPYGVNSYVGVNMGDNQPLGALHIGTVIPDGTGDSVSLYITSEFTEDSSPAKYAAIDIEHTVIQTGGGTGKTWAIHQDASLTNVANYYFIESEIGKVSFSLITFSSGTFNVMDYRTNVYTGTGTSTATLPVPTNYLGVEYEFKNRGTDVLTIDVSGGGSTIFTNAAAASTPVAVGGAARLISDGTYWLLMSY